MRIDLIDSLNRLVHDQHCLRKFRMHRSYFDIESGLKCLQRLAEASAATIHDLSLYGFFEIGKSIFREGRVLTEMQKFTGLSRIQLYYAEMSEELVKTWVTGCPNLSFIKFLAFEYAHPAHVITCETWTSLVSTHPNLLVELRASMFHDVKRLLEMLSPAIPLLNLSWSTYKEAATEIELTIILHRVAHYHRTIKHLYLRLLGPFPNLNTTTVQNILSECKNLLPFRCWNVFPYCGEQNLWQLYQQHLVV
ncbi:unnamed protein product [Lymnaea stagnalis]|uniref:Uncharacterized protein n=1 Tax=Lymnaea stagnalis TaxID=6523 RepID=A0AAV2HLE2_LYMST